MSLRYHKHNPTVFAFQTERGEWMQFQADLQVAVAVADRLRAEAEEELTVLRAAHSDLRKELADAQQRQEEVDMQMNTLRGELTESKQRLTTLGSTEGKTDSPRQEPERPNGDSTSKSDSKATTRGRERVIYRSRQEGNESGSLHEATDARTELRSVTKRYLRNVTNEDRSGDEVRSSETPKMGTTERSRWVTGKTQKQIHPFSSLLENLSSIMFASRCHVCMSCLCNAIEVFPDYLLP